MMKKIFNVLIISVLFVTSCGGYDDTEINNRISDIESRLTALESQCKSLNSNVNSLQGIVTALQGNDGISGFKELDDKSGYVISFTSGKTITILNGTNGINGTTPAISVKQDIDGVYYWTVNGAWLQVGGNKVKAVGTDAITPQFKIDNYVWYVSYDKSTTWSKVESNVTEGCYLFKSVTIESGYVQFTLADGTTTFSVPVYGSAVSAIKSIIYVPAYSNGVARVFKSWDKYFATMKFEVQPASALESIASNTAITYKMNAVYTLTKGGDVDSTKLTISDITVKGAFIEFKVACDSLGKSFLSGSHGVSASLRISDGFNTVAGEYVPMIYGGEAVKPTEFDGSNVVLSLAAISDVHIGNNSTVSNKFSSALTQLKSKASVDDADGLDGVLVAGDLIDNPNTTYLSTFKSLYEGVLDPKKVPMIYTPGNHDVNNYKWTTSSVSQAQYMRTTLGANYFLTDQDPVSGTSFECRHCLVGGYHVLTMLPNGTQPVTYDPVAVTWLDNQLKAITTAEPDKYVIIITHPMVSNTVYGSMLGEASGVWDYMSGYWASSALTSVLDKYPQAVIFGGHLHFALNDPRSIWQGAFTALGCASVRYMSVENAKYEDMSGATTMNDANDFSQGNLVQFDSNDNMRVYRMDFYNKAVIGDPLTLSHPTEDLNHLRKYSHTVRSLSNQAPTLSSMTVCTVDGVTTVTFAAGKDDEFVHDYSLTLFKEGTVQVTKYILADFYKHPKPADMKSSWTVSLGNIGYGNFSVKLKADDSWGASATLTKNFVLAQDGNMWTNDAAGSKSFSGGTGSVTSDWLSYSDGTLSWTANTTGAPRIASITLPNTVVCQVSQLAESDFKGSWNFTSKTFCKDNFVSVGSKVTLPSITFGSPLKGETLTDGAGIQHINNIGISGLYHSGIIADAAVKINYTAKTVAFGLFMDARTAHLDAAPSNSSYPYIAFLPETTTIYTDASSWGGTGTWSFVTPDLGSPDYEWMWFTVNDDFKTLTYSAAKAQVLSTSNTSKYGQYIIGLTVQSFSAPDVTLANSQSKSTTNYDNVIYQFNTNNDSIGLVFKRN